jgi:hypothetical protein
VAFDRVRVVGTYCLWRAFLCHTHALVSLYPGARVN